MLLVKVSIINSTHPVKIYLSATVSLVGTLTLFEESDADDFSIKNSSKCSNFIF